MYGYKTVVVTVGIPESSHVNQNLNKLICPPTNWKLFIDNLPNQIFSNVLTQINCNYL